MGNKDLKAETSINKEVGIEFRHEGYQAGVTWFRNDYRNKIESGTYSSASTTTKDTRILKWKNIDKALIEGFEETLNISLSEKIKWHNNITWMLKSKNKTNRDYLSITLKFIGQLAGDGMLIAAGGEGMVVRNLKNIITKAKSPPGWIGMRFHLMQYSGLADHIRSINMPV